MKIKESLELCDPGERVGDQSAGRRAVTTTDLSGLQRGKGTLLGISREAIMSKSSKDSDCVLLVS